MKKYKIKISFVSPEGPKAWSNMPGINFMIFILCSFIIFSNLKSYIVFQYGKELVLIQRISIGLEAILEN